MTYHLSLKNRILAYVMSKFPAIIHKGLILRISSNDWGYESENAGRRCRELVKEGRIENVPDEKGRARYRYLPPKLL